MPMSNSLICQPQLKDLPRDSTIAVTCRSCARQWSRDVRDMVETQRLGAQYMDLLEWQARCEDPACNGHVDYAYAGKPQVQPHVAQVVTLPRPKAERLPYPVKAVVKPRQPVAPMYARPQYALPMPMPRTVQPVRATSSVAGR